MSEADDWQAILERVRAIKDPEVKARVRERLHRWVVAENQASGMSGAQGGAGDQTDLAVPGVAERRQLAKKGQALPGGGFPIRNEADLRKAIRAIGRAKNPAAAKRHIIKRARALGKSDLIPESWRTTDLARAMTKDGRPSFKNQGKWKHGFVPVDDKAVQAKAKGSPIARRRIERIYRSTVRNTDRRVSETGDILVKNASGGQERVKSVAQARNPEVSATRQTQRVELDTRERALGGGRTRRSSKAWEDIPDTQKVIRNGKRYVLTTFRGKHQLTQWFGPSDNWVETGDPNKRRWSSITAAQAKKMSTAQLRSLLRVKGQPASVKKILRAVMEQKYEQNRKRA